MSNSNTTVSCALSCEFVARHCHTSCGSTADRYGMPALRESDDDAATARSTGSGRSRSARSRVPLSARSAALSAANSMHANSYTYLSDRVYSFLEARSVWKQRVQSEDAGDDGVQETLKRLPEDFEPFFAIGTRRRLGEGRGASTYDEGEGPEGRATGLAFRLAFAVFSSRAWDGLYLLLGLLWSVLCPGYLDGAMGVERAQLASLLLVMFALVAAPVMAATILKSLCYTELRSRFRGNTRSTSVFFVLATKAISAPPVCAGCQRWGWRSEWGRRVHTLAADSSSGGSGSGSGGRGQEVDSSLEAGTFYENGRMGKREERAPLGGSNSLQRSSSEGDRYSSKQEQESQSSRERGKQKGGGGGGSAIRTGGVGGLGRNADSGGGAGGGGGGGRAVNGTGPTKTTKHVLPARNWKCTVCKKVNVFPEEWDGRAGKAVEVVIKRKKVDTQAMYGAFKTKLALPTCGKCRTPFNYSWRSGRRDEGIHVHADGRGNALSFSRKPSRPTTSSSTCGEDDTADGSPAASSRSRMLMKMVGSIRNFVLHSREALPEETGEKGAVDDSADPELWYGNEFRHQLKTYFNPELERPSLSLRGGRYPIGARVACFAGKDTWYPGAVATSRENNTYDVRYDNGDIAQHVFPHMIRFEPTHSDSGLICCYYGLALAAAAMWPLMGVWYFSTASTSTAAEGMGAVVAVPALVVGVAGTVAVVLQFGAIHRENKSTGPRVAVKYAAVAALPSASLALVGITAIAKALHPSSTGSWVKMLLLPSMLFSITGGGYAHAVSPAYGIAWAAASPPWLLFLLLVTLRLDGAAGDASPALGRMRWLGVYFPLWLLVIMVIAAYCVLPYVWDIEVLPETNGIPGGWWQAWLSRLAGRGRDTMGATDRRPRGTKGADVTTVGVDDDDDSGEQDSQDGVGHNGNSSLHKPRPVECCL